MKHLSLRYILLVISIMFFYSVFFPFIAVARYVCQHYRLGSHTSALLCGHANHLAYVVNRCSGRSSMLMVQSCSFVIVINVCVAPSKFFLDKFSHYSQQQAASITGAVYACALVFMTVAGCLIVRIRMRVPL